MYLLVASGRMRMSELAARLGITSSTATGAVDRLVELGLIERHEDPADRRQVVVSATPTAAATLEHFRELNSRRMREILGRLDPDELATVERAMQVLDAAVAAETVPPPSTKDRP
jgi:DNA-binding MarR family transcriptional regulator